MIIVNYNLYVNLNLFAVNSTAPSCRIGMMIILTFLLYIIVLYTINI